VSDVTVTARLGGGGGGEEDPFGSDEVVAVLYCGPKRRIWAANRLFTADGATRDSDMFFCLRVGMNMYSRHEQLRLKQLHASRASLVLARQASVSTTDYS